MPPLLGGLQPFVLCSQNKRHWSPGKVTPHLSHFNGASLFSSISTAFETLLSLAEAGCAVDFECCVRSLLAHRARLYCCDIARSETVTAFAPAKPRLSPFTSLTFPLSSFGFSAIWHLAESLHASLLGNAYIKWNQ